MYYLIEFKDKKYTIHKDSLRLFAMTLGLYSSTINGCIKLLKQHDINVTEIITEVNQWQSVI